MCRRKSPGRRKPYGSLPDLSSSCLPWHPRGVCTWVWLKIKQEGLRRFWSMFPLTRVPCWYRFFEPQPHVPFYFTIFVAAGGLSLELRSRAQGRSTASSVADDLMRRELRIGTGKPPFPSICLRICLFHLLVLKGVYHYWNFFFQGSYPNGSSSCGTPFEC